MFKWAKKKKEEPPVYYSHALHIERRLHARIRYPQIGAVGELPVVVFEGREIKPTNLSLGGFLIDDPVLASLKMQEVKEFHFIWKQVHKDIVQKARVVRVSSSGLHLRYEDLNPQLLVNLSLALKPGIRAQKASKTDIKQVNDPRVRELWTSPSGEQINFYSENPLAPDARIRLPPKDLLVDPFRGIFLGERATPQSELVFQAKAPAWILHDLVIFLSNVTNPSERILGLLAQLEKLV